MSLPVCVAALPTIIHCIVCHSHFYASTKKSIFAPSVLFQKYLDVLAKAGMQQQTNEKGRN